MGGAAALPWILGRVSGLERWAADDVLEQSRPLGGLGVFRARPKRWCVACNQCPTPITFNKLPPPFYLGPNERQPVERALSRAPSRRSSLDGFALDRYGFDRTLAPWPWAARTRPGNHRVARINCSPRLARGWDSGPRDSPCGRALARCDWPQPSTCTPCASRGWRRRSGTRLR